MADRFEVPQQTVSPEVLSEVIRRRLEVAGGDAGVVQPDTSREVHTESPTPEEVTAARRALAQAAGKLGSNE